MEDKKEGIFAGPAGLPGPDLVELAVENMNLTCRLGAALTVIESVERERVLADKLVRNQEIMIKALRDTVERQEAILNRLHAASPQARIDKWNEEITAKVRELIH